MFWLKITTALLLAVCVTNTSLASEGSTYQFKWLDQDKEVFVLQNRKYRKKNRLYLNLGIGITTSGPFSDARAIQGRAGYFIGEEWGVELLYSKNDSQTNDTFDSVKNATGAVPFVRQTSGYIGGMLMWSPFYAKINTFNNIIYFDWLFGVGVASLTEENNRNDFGIGTTTFGNLAEETHSAIMWDIGLQFYISDNWALRLDFTATHYNAPEASDANSLGGEEDINSNYDLTLAVSVRF